MTGIGIVRIQHIPRLSEIGDLLAQADSRLIEALAKSIVAMGDFEAALEQLAIDQDREIYRGVRGV